MIHRRQHHDKKSLILAAATNHPAYLQVRGTHAPFLVHNDTRGFWGFLHLLCPRQEKEVQPLKQPRAPDTGILAKI